MPTIKAQLAPLRAASPSPAKPAATTASKSRAMTVPVVPVITTEPKASAACRAALRGVARRPSEGVEQVWSQHPSRINRVSEGWRRTDARRQPSVRGVKLLGSELLGDEAIADPGNGVD